MKKLILTLFTINIASMVFAQTDTVHQLQFPPDIDKTNYAMDSLISPEENKDYVINYSDGVLFKNGKMWLINNHKMTSLKYTMTMTNGTKVMNDGTYMKKAKSFKRFREGEHMDMNGTITEVK
jgi:hypothetical protein